MADRALPETEHGSIEHIHSRTHRDEQERLQAASNHHSGPDPGIHAGLFISASLIGQPKPDPQCDRRE